MSVSDWSDGKISVGLTPILTHKPKHRLVMKV